MMGIPFPGGGQSGRSAFKGGRCQKVPGTPQKVRTGRLLWPPIAPHSCCSSAVAASARRRQLGGRGHRSDF